MTQFVRTHMWPKTRRWMLGAFVLLAFGVQAAPPLEYQVKASYLYNFMQFVMWPDDVFGPDGIFNLCVVGAERFGGALAVLENEPVETRRISVRSLASPAQAAELRCHMLFVARGATGSDELPRRRGMLVIGETPGFLRHGGMINLIEIDRRIRFEINHQAAGDADLQISSRLLKLAVTP